MSYYSRIRKKIDFCKSQLKWLYRRAMSGQWNQEYLLEQRNAMIYNRKEFSSLPNWAKSELTGYMDATRERFYDENLVFCHVVDEQPRTIPEYRAMAEVDPSLHKSIALAKDYGTFWRESREPFSYTGPDK